MTLLNSPPLRLQDEFFHVSRITESEKERPRRQHRVVAVMPAYNAERTLAPTLADIPAGAVDEVIPWTTAAPTGPWKSRATWA
jgi:hypothetical protein